MVPLNGNTQLLQESSYDNLMAQTWESAFEIIGLDGINNTHNCGNCINSKCKVSFSIRISPSADDNAVCEEVRAIYTKQPPFNCSIQFAIDQQAPGWQAKEITKQQMQIINNISNNHFGNDAALIGEGGSIPIVNLLNKKFPDSNIIVTGVLGPNGNAHGPNECLNLQATYKITSCLIDMIQQF